MNPAARSTRSANALETRHKRMFRKLHNRCGHYGLLLAVAVALTLPNLGAPSLWDIDEGNNAEAAREMMDCGNWVVPTFNYQLRVDKPALLYWLQVGAFRVFGINRARCTISVRSGIAPSRPDDL